MRSFSVVVGRKALRFVAAFFVALLGIAFTMEMQASGKIDLFNLRVNRFSRDGKVDIGVMSDVGQLKLNLLDNDYFQRRASDERAIFLYGTSVAFPIPQVKFRYGGHAYRLYNFAIPGNPSTPTLKIFSIMSSFRPFAALLSLTPAQSESNPYFKYQPFGNECLGALRTYGFGMTEFSAEDSCNFLRPMTRRLSARRVVENIWQLLVYPVHKNDDFDRRFKFFRSTLASTGNDAVNEIRALARFSPKRHMNVLPEIDLGEITRASAMEKISAINAEVAKMPDLPNPKPAQQANSLEKWDTVHTNKSLAQGGEIRKFYLAMAELAARQDIKMIFYNQPLMNETPGVFPPGYYQEYRDLLKDMAQQAHAEFLDEGNFMSKKGGVFQDTFHMNVVGLPLFAKTLILDLIVAGGLDEPPINSKRVPVDEFPIGRAN